MAYRVEIARNAEAELEELYLWVVARAPQQGAKWFNGLERAVLSLDQHPKRCPVAPESIDLGQPVRVLSLQPIGGSGSYRSLHSGAGFPNHIHPM
jgi:plasmid stabilization system protein ParE